MAESLNILLVEDEFMTRRMLKSKLKAMGHNIAGEADNTDDAVSILENEKVDVAILDINLGQHKKDGIWLGEYIRFNQKIPFLYLTAYETTDIVDRAVNTQPHAYLTKPFSDLSLRTTLAIAGQQHDKVQPIESIDHLLVKHEKLLKKVLLDDIMYIESEGNYLLVNTPVEQFRYRSTIGNVLKNLPGEKYLQTHRAFVVNKDYVEGFNRSVVSVRGREIPISKGRLNEVTECLSNA